MSRAGYIDKTLDTLKLGKVFQNYSKHWVYSLIVNSYHLISEEKFESEQLATESMKKEFDNRKSD